MNPAPTQLARGGRGAPVSTDWGSAKVQFSANGLGPPGAVLTVLPTMLLLPPLSTPAAGAREGPFSKILHLAMHAPAVPTTFSPVPLLLDGGAIDVDHAAEGRFGRLNAASGPHGSRTNAWWILEDRPNGVAKEAIPSRPRRNTRKGRDFILRPIEDRAGFSSAGTAQDQPVRYWLYFPRCCYCRRCRRG